MKRAMNNITVLIFITIPAYSQFHAGFYGGMNDFNYKSYSLKQFDLKQKDLHKRTFINFGLVFDYQFAKHVLVHSEVQYIQKGTLYRDDDGDKSKFTASYLEVPLFLKVELGSKYKLYVLAGPYAGIYLDGEVSVSDDGFNGKADIKKLMEDVDFGVGAGAGVSWNIGRASLFFEGSFRKGLTNVFKGGTAYVDLGGIGLPFEMPPINLKTRGMVFKSGIMFSFDLSD